MNWITRLDALESRTTRGCATCRTWPSHRVAYPDGEYLSRYELERRALDPPEPPAICPSCRYERPLITVVYQEMRKHDAN